MIWHSIDQVLSDKDVVVYNNINKKKKTNKLARKTLAIFN